MINMKIQLIHGDCLEVLHGMADNSIDSIVTDPPYGLTQNKKGGSGVASVNLESPYGRSRISTGNGAGGFMGHKWDNDVPSVEIWTECLRVLKPGGHLLAFAGTRTQHRMTARIEDSGFEIRDMIAWVYGSGFPKSHNGPWGGTALKPALEPITMARKPALEPITMARKPLIGTVAANVLQHGTGGLNIDGCRVPIDQDANASPLGRWPANLIHDGSDEVLLQFPQSKGQQGDVRGTEPSLPTNGIYGDFAKRLPSPARNDSGSAARFFYCPKASKKERGDGNVHPTVKPTDLMSYLCRLVTPSGGVVLDPFMGSGSTGKAAVREGFHFIGIERELDYFNIAQTRIERENLPEWLR